jgi:protocatechuate 3,4-dioxygenase beta subunit
MKKWLFLLVPLSLLSMTGCAQNSSSSPNSPSIGGACEGCEAIDESPVPFEQLTNMIWLPDWKDTVTRLAVNGIVYKADGKTPAPGVIIYIYHTDQTGVYPKKGDEKGWAKQHGYIRGWMKTNEKGEYKFFTRRPVAYPGGTVPAHIHVIIKEPGKNAYWIEEYVFDDDPLLTKEERSKLRNRGGSGILKFRPYFVGRELVKSERHIYLGKNIEAYQQ